MRLVGSQVITAWVWAHFIASLGAFPYLAVSLFKSELGAMQAEFGLNNSIYPFCQCIFLWASIP